MESVDDNGAPELPFTCCESESGYGDGLYFIHDAVTKELEYGSGEPTGGSRTGTYRIRHANVDAYPQSEIFITTSQTYTAQPRRYDSTTARLLVGMSSPTRGLRSLTVASRFWSRLGSGRVSDHVVFRGPARFRVTTHQPPG